MLIMRTCKKKSTVKVAPKSYHDKVSPFESDSLINRQTLKWLLVNRWNISIVEYHVDPQLDAISQWCLVLMLNIHFHKLTREFLIFQGPINTINECHQTGTV